MEGSGTHGRNQSNGNETDSHRQTLTDRHPQTDTRRQATADTHEQTSADKHSQTDIHNQASTDLEALGDKLAEVECPSVNEDSHPDRIAHAFCASPSIHYMVRPFSIMLRAYDKFPAVMLLLLHRGRKI